MKLMATGKRIIPYNCENGLLVSSAKAKMAILPPASIIETCIQAMKVRSLEKKTLGSILMGALRILCNWDVAVLGFFIMTDRCDEVDMALDDPRTLKMLFHQEVLFELPVALRGPVLFCDEEEVG